MTIKVTGNLSLTSEEFCTILIHIEVILNSRPISPLFENSNEILPLIPGHFLRGAPLIVVPEVSNNPSDENLSFMKRGNRLQAIQQLFACLSKTTYIIELQSRSKWRAEKDSLKENDFIVIKEDLLPPTKWQLG